MGEEWALNEERGEGCLAVLISQRLRRPSYLEFNNSIIQDHDFNHNPPERKRGKVSIQQREKIPRLWVDLKFEMISP